MHDYTGLLPIAWGIGILIIVKLIQEHRKGKAAADHVEKVASTSGAKIPKQPVSWLIAIVWALALLLFIIILLTRR